MTHLRAFGTLLSSNVYIFHESRLHSDIVQAYFEPRSLSNLVVDFANLPPELQPTVSKLIGAADRSLKRLLSMLQAYLIGLKFVFMASHSNILISCFWSKFLVWFAMWVLELPYSNMNPSPKLLANGTWFCRIVFT